MATVIPYDRTEEVHVKLPCKRFLECLQMLEVCNSPTPGLPEIQPERGRAAGGAYYDYIVDQMERSPHQAVFEVHGVQYFVVCLQALMLWCLREKERAVCIRLVHRGGRAPARRGPLPGEQRLRAPGALLLPLPVALRGGAQPHRPQHPRGGDPRRRGAAPVCRGAVVRVGAGAEKKIFNARRPVYNKEKGTPPPTPTA